MTLRARFEAKVRRTDHCWIWTAYKRNGYGQIGVGGRAGQNRQATAVAYELFVGPYPDGLDLDHLCRNPACVNPAHLEPVTHAENCRRGLRSTTTAEQIARGQRLMESGLSLRKAAKEVGCSHSQLSRVLRGIHRPDLHPETLGWVKL